MSASPDDHRLADPGLSTHGAATHGSATSAGAGASSNGVADSLLIEPFGGLAGDMLLAALLDLRDPRLGLDDLRALARELVPGEATLEAETVWRGSLSGLQLTVRTAESHTLPHRGYRDLAQILERSTLSKSVIARACAVLWRLAEAEGAVHGCSPEEIHFHEIGAVDSLIDVAGVCFALERLGVRRVLSTPPLVGSGYVKCAHGQMPAPAPAVAQLLRGRDALLEGEGERLTPTGAALLVEFTERFAAPGPFRAERIGYGAGHRDPRVGPPNLARVQLGSSRALAAPRARVVELECNLDDASGELVGHLVGELRARGALEVWTSAVSMKKDRPGVLLTLLCREAEREQLEDCLFEHSPTLGVRWSLRERTECERQSFALELLGATVRGQRRVRPRANTGQPSTARDLFFEYDDLVALARASGLSLREVEHACLREALERLH